MSLSDIFAVVDNQAQKLGVPTRLWEAIAKLESGYNPNVIGDNGTSFGLFQLHIGGQANTALQQGYIPNQLLDPSINAQFGLPAIADTWSKLKGSFDDSLSWWTKFAGASGHPGVGSNTASVAALLKQNYDTGGGGGGVTTGGTLTSSTTSQLSDTTSTTSSISQFAKNVGVALLFFVIALTLLLIGIVILR